MDGGRNSKINAVVFDIGGVLLQWDPERLYRELIPNAELRRWFLQEVCTLEWNAQLDAGRPFDDACDELASRYPDHADLVHAWKRQDEMIAGEVPGTADIVRSLRNAGTPLYLLTNMPTEVFASRRARFEVLRLFDGAVVSGEEGVLKPSAAIFRRLTERFSLEPGHTLVIDDSVTNVRGAQRAGFVAHHFTDATTLAEALTALGFRVA